MFNFYRVAGLILKFFFNVLEGNFITNLLNCGVVGLFCNLKPLLFIFSTLDLAYAVLPNFIFENNLFEIYFFGVYECVC